ncbi:MAG: hypothetical protein ACYCQJ_12865 [Nitrososphaerales archaeon]
MIYQGLDGELIHILDSSLCPVCKAPLVRHYHEATGSDLTHWPDSTCKYAGRDDA